MIALGRGLFEKKSLFETYIDESVQGSTSAHRLNSAASWREKGVISLTNVDTMQRSYCSRADFCDRQFISVSECRRCEICTSWNAVSAFVWRHRDLRCCHLESTTRTWRAIRLWRSMAPSILYSIDAAGLRS